MAHRCSTRAPVAVEEGTCAFCRGKGLDPFDVMSAQSRCCVCGGSGKVQIPTPAVTCAHCRGTGAVKTMTCTSCGGKGAVARPELPIVVCPACRGTGDDASAPALACLNCRGAGCVTSRLPALNPKP